MAPMFFERRICRNVLALAAFLACTPRWLLSDPPTASSRPASLERGEVTITTLEYRRLIETVEGKMGRPPADVTFDSARFRVTIDRETAVFEETFRARTRAAGWVSSPFLRAGLDRASIAPAGRGFFFVAREVNQLALFGPGSAEGEITARIAGTSGADARRSFSLALPLIPVQRGRVELPGTKLEVLLTGGEILSRTERGDQTLLEVAGRAGALLTVSFRQKNIVESRASAPLAASASVYARFEVVGANLLTDVTARLVPTAGKISAIEFLVPVGSKVLFLRGPGLLAPETSPDRVRAARASPLSDPLEAHLRLTSPVDETVPIPLPLPRLILPGPVDLYVDFRAPQGALAETVDLGSLQAADVKDLPPVLRPLGAEAEEILHLSASASPEVRPPIVRLHRLDSAPVLTAQVRIARGRSLVSRSGRALSRIEYEVVSSIKPFLTIHLPEGSSFWGAEAMGKPILPAMPEKGSIAIPLRTGRLRLARVVAYVLSPLEIPRGRGTLVFQPPSTDIPISKLQWTFALPSGAEYRIEGSEYREAAATDLPVPSLEPERGASELAQRAQQALAQETRAAGRAPIVPRMPDVAEVVALRTELPAAVLPPIKLAVRPRKDSEVWR